MPANDDEGRGFRLRAGRVALQAFIVASVGLVCNFAGADLKDSHEGPQAAWRLAEADGGVRILRQQRSFRDAHTGSGCENIRFIAGQGTKIFFTYPLGQAPVIPEFQPSVWVKAGRPNLQFIARAVLPRSIDPRTGKPLTALLRGESYTEVGSWQRLVVADVPKLLQREVVILRSQFGKDVDEKEAYIDMLVINAYCGEGELDLWIDDLEVLGFVPDAAITAERPDLATSIARGPKSPTTIALQGQLLVVNGRPFFPRIIEHQGEPLDYLQSLGFNGVRVPVSPSADLLKEAQRLGMWLVTPPPPTSDQIGAAYDTVIGWSLGRRLTSVDLEETRALANQLVRNDPHPQRPALASAESHLEEFSRAAGIVISERAFLGTNLEMADYAAWLRQRSAAMRPGSPFWASVDTIPSQPLREQVSLLCPQSVPTWDLDLDVLRCQIFTAISAGARGLIFRSDLPLDDSTGGRLRADVLKLANQELLLLDPWAAAGRLREELTAPSPARVAMLQSDRSRVVLVTQQLPALQYSAGPAPLTKVNLVVPGVPASDRPFLLSPSGLKELRGVHGSTGLRFTIEDPGLAAAVVITQDPLAVNHLFRNSHDARTGVARLKSQLAAYRLATAAAVDRELTEAGHPLAAAPAALKEAQSYYDQSRKLLGSGETEGLHTFLQRVEAGISRVERGHWEQTAAVFPSPASSPLCSAFQLLPLHWELAERLSAGSWTPNLLPAGDMEHLPTMLQAGWKQERSEPGGVRTDVALAIATPHSGASALRLAASGGGGKNAPDILERPLVTITSAPVAVRPGQVVRIHGWVNVTKPLQGSREGLWIYDSLAGASLAERVRETRGWREFTLYRAARKAGPMSVHFALFGLGEVFLDDVQVTLLQPEPVREVGFSGR